MKSTIILALEDLQCFRGEYTQKHKREIENLYKQVFRESFTPTSCSNCYHDAVDKMWAYIRKHGDVMPEREFILKHGAVINVGEFGSGRFYIRHTLTDDLALEYLRKKPAGIREFEAYPADWKERLSKPVAKSVTKTTTKKKKKK
jgi:hypothetical protein